MKKDHLPIKKLAKNIQRSKLWARVPKSVSSCPTAAHMYR